MKKRQPLKRKTPLRRISQKRAKEAKEYMKIREGFLEEFPICEVCTKAKSTDVHHMDKRGKNYLAKDTWLSVCRMCHTKIHEHPSWARANNYLI